MLKFMIIGRAFIASLVLVAGLPFTTHSCLAAAHGLNLVEVDPHATFLASLTGGCTNPYACNFDPSATEDDNSCVFPEPGLDCNGDCLFVGVSVVVTNSNLPADMSGEYFLSSNCSSESGGVMFGGVDHNVCFNKADGSSWRIWNTGCGWEIGQMEEDPFFGELNWVRYARSYTGLCAAMPSVQLSAFGLETDVFYDDFGQILTGIVSTYMPCECIPSAEVVMTEGGSLPASLAGTYILSADCYPENGGGVGQSVCFFGANGDGWMIMNTGCGWEIGRMEPDPFFGDLQWVRYARSYSGFCNQMPDVQLSIEALNAEFYYDDFGNSMTFLSSTLDLCLVEAVAGCMYAAASNYNPSATEDDGSCTFAPPVVCGPGTYFEVQTGECLPTIDAACASDLNADGLVNTTDLLTFLGAFGSACGD